MTLFEIQELNAIDHMISSLHQRLSELYVQRSTIVKATGMEADEEELSPLESVDFEKIDISVDNTVLPLSL